MLATGAFFVSGGVESPGGRVMCFDARVKGDTLLQPGPAVTRGSGRRSLAKRLATAARRGASRIGEKAMRPLATIEEFREAVESRSLVIVRDSKFGDRVHRLPCEFVTNHTFQMKVLANPGRAGKFFVIEEAEAEGTRRCPKCP